MDTIDKQAITSRLAANNVSAVWHAEDVTTVKYSYNPVVFIRRVTIYLGDQVVYDVAYDDVCVQTHGFTVDMSLHAQTSGTIRLYFSERVPQVIQDMVPVANGVVCA